MPETYIIVLRGLNNAAYGAFLSRWSEKNQMRPIAIDPPPAGTKATMRRELPPFEPPFRVPRTTLQACIPIITPLQLFLAFLGEASLQNIVLATNETAAAEMSNPQPPAARYWHPLSRHELLRWIGLLFYMGRHTEPTRDDYWSLSLGHKLGQFMCRNQWDQILRFLSISPHNAPENINWWAKIEPVASTVRVNCQTNVVPASWLAIDEAMIAFTGKSDHTVKLKNKPIKKGFKL